MSNNIKNLMQSAFAASTTLHVLGDPGSGKTAIILANAAQAAAELTNGTYKPEDINVIHIDGTSLAADTLMYSVPAEITTEKEQTQYVLRHILSSQLKPKKLADGRTAPTVLIVDDAHQADRSVANALKELKQNYSIGGTDLAGPLNLIGAVFADNTSLDHTQTPMDAASGGRGRPVEITLADTEEDVRKYLAEKYNIEETKLGAITEKILTLPGETKEILNWRTLENVIWNIKNDLPPKLGLPVADSWEYPGLYDTNGNDITDEFLSEIVQATGMGENRNWKNLRKRVAAAARRDSDGAALRIIGPPGGGKTAGTFAEAEEVGETVIYLEGSKESPEMNYLSFPNEEFTSMETVLREEYVAAVNGQKSIAVIDEASLLPASLHSMLNSLIQKREVAGIKLNGCNVVIALENPENTVQGPILDATPMNLTTASRFRSTIIETEYDFEEAYRYMRSAALINSWKTSPVGRGGMFNELRENFFANVTDEEITTIVDVIIKWHQDQVPAAEKQQISPRTLTGIVRAIAGEMYRGKTQGYENVFSNHELIEQSLAKVLDDSGKFGPIFNNKVAIKQLETGLSGINIINLKTITQNLENWLPKLQNGEQQSALTVHAALRESMSSGGPEILDNMPAVHALQLGLYECLPSGPQLAESLQEMIENMQASGNIIAPWRQALFVDSGGVETVDNKPETLTNMRELDLVSKTFSDMFEGYAKGVPLDGAGQRLEVIYETHKTNHSNQMETVKKVIKNMYENSTKKHNVGIGR